MIRSRQPLILAIWLIVLGAGWLLNNLQIIPGVNWIWTLGLGIVGIVVVVAGGINKVTVIIGPFLVIASVLSYLRQSGKLDVAYELPGLTALLGVLILVAHVRTVLPPPWLQPADGRSKRAD